MNPRLLIALGLIAAVFAVYAPVRHHDFVDYDDLKHIVLNPDVQAGLGPASWKVFHAPHYGDFIPLTYLTLQFDQSVFGGSPGAIHAVNVALHAASAVLLFLALHAMTGAVGRSAFVAAAFALHPLRVESVAWAFERKDVLSVFFWMLGMWCYARPPGEELPLRRQLGVASSLVLGLLSKPLLVTFPFALLLLDYWPLARLRGAGDAGAWPKWEALRRAIFEKAPLFAIVGIAVVWTLISQAGASIPEPARLDFARRCIESLTSLGFYAWKSLWPLDLVVFYPPDYDAIAWGPFLLSALFVAATSVWVVRAAGRRPYLVVGWLWYLGTLVPVLGLIQLGMHLRADRYSYVPQIGLAWMLAWGVTELWERSRAPRAWLAAAALALLVGLALASAQQVAHWKDTRSLFEHAVEASEKNFLAHWRLGVSYAQAGRRRDAMTQFEKAAALAPDFVMIQYELAQTLEDAGRHDAALAGYRLTLALDPAHAQANARSGILLAARGDPRAQAYLERALREDSAHAHAHAALAEILRAQGREGDALRHYREALAAKPNYLPAMNNLADLLAGSVDPSLRDPQEAIRLASAVLEALPSPSPAVLDTLAAAHAAAGDRPEALRIAEQALELAELRGDRPLADVIRHRVQALREERP